MFESVIMAAVGSALLLMRSEIGPFLIVRPFILGTLFGAAVGMPLYGLLFGACVEWVWIDRIPAGGVRVPAASVGLVAALVGLHPHISTASVEPMLFGVGMFTIGFYILLFIPLDGGLRRLWGGAYDNTILALQKNSWPELAAFLMIALIGRFTFVALLLLSAVLFVHGLLGAIAATPLAEILVQVPWHWVVAGAVLAFFARNHGGRLPLAWGSVFVIGALIGWLR